MSSDSEDSVWYAKGLRFSCEQCGGCCTGAPGYVFVTQEDIERIATFLGQDCLTRSQIRRVGSRYSLTEDRSNGDCCFLERDGERLSCRIYPVRPVQCRTWPFWSSNLGSPDDWADAADGCPGINHGHRFSLEEIELRRRARRIEDVPE